MTGRASVTVVGVGLVLFLLSNVGVSAQTKEPLHGKDYPLAAPAQPGFGIVNCRRVA